MQNAVRDDVAGGPPRGCLIVEDRPDTRDWLAEVVLEAFPGIALASAASVHEARGWIAAHAAGQTFNLQLSIVDLGLPDGSGVEVIRELSATFPFALSVVATIYDDDLHLMDSLAAGAQGYVLKQDDPGAVVECLKRIEKGEPPLSPSIARRMLELLRPGHATPPVRDEIGLTPREVEVLALLARGLTGPEVARIIGLKPQTVATYVKVIYQKLHVSSRAEATMAAVSRGLV